MATLISAPVHLQLVLGFGLCALALLSLARPDVGLALSGIGMVLMGSTTYAELGPTSPQLTTAAIYLVGGLIATGLAGMVRHKGTATVAERRPASLAGAHEWRADFLDDILETPALGHADRRIAPPAFAAEPRRLPGAPSVSFRARRSAPPATAPREEAWS